MRSDDLEDHLKGRVMIEFCYKMTLAKSEYGKEFIHKLVVLALRAMATRDDAKRADCANRIYAHVLAAPNCAEFMKSPYAAPLFELLRYYRHCRRLH